MQQIRQRIGNPASTISIRTRPTNVGVKMHIIDASIVSHGVTDAFVVPEMCLWYMTCLCRWPCTETLFMLASAAHFSDDMGGCIPSCIAVSAASSLHRMQRETNAVAALKAFMACIHVPRHHLRIWRQSNAVRGKTKRNRLGVLFAGVFGVIAASCSPPSVALNISTLPEWAKRVVIVHCCIQPASHNPMRSVASNVHAAAIVLFPWTKDVCNTQVGRVYAASAADGGVGGRPKEPTRAPPARHAVTTRPTSSEPSPCRVQPFRPQRPRKRKRRPPRECTMCQSKQMTKTSGRNP